MTVDADSVRAAVERDNEDMRRQWEEKEQFPPYEFSLEKGKELFATAFANGKHYADCFPKGGIGIRQNYPQFDQKSGEMKRMMTIKYTRVGATKAEATKP